MTSSRMCATPAATDDGCAWIVVERVYTIHPFPSRGSAPVAPPVPRTTFLPRIGHSNGLAKAKLSRAFAEDGPLEMAGHGACLLGLNDAYRCAGCGHRASPHRRFD